MRKKILLVDDTKTLAESLADTLYMEGYDVWISANGLQAITDMKQFFPALIITDLIMPEMDGLEFIRHYRRQNVGHQLPIIVLTADTNEDNDGKALDAGANLLLHKPFDYEHLISQVKQLLNG
jgi:DNA-binding response OmpR family regulator